jgi:hypothetical protein
MLAAASVEMYLCKKKPVSKKTIFETSGTKLAAISTAIFLVFNNVVHRYFVAISIGWDRFPQLSRAAICNYLIDLPNGSACHSS